MPISMLQRIAMLAAVGMLSVAMYVPSLVQAQTPPDAAVEMDISLLPVGDRFGAPSLGKTLRRVLVVRVSEDADVSGRGWFQVELISPEGKTVSRHASPEVSLSPGSDIQGRYLFPRSTADRFPELLEPVYINNEDGERILRKNAFGFSDDFTFVGEGVAAEGEVFTARLMLFLKNPEGGADLIGDTSMTLIVNEPKS